MHGHAETEIGCIYSNKDKNFKANHNHTMGMRKNRKLYL